MTMMPEIDLDVLKHYQNLFWEFQEHKEEMFFHLDQQPEPFQRKSYLNNSRKEFRHFKPNVIRIVPNSHLKRYLQYGTAIMKIVSDDTDSDEEETEQPQICEMDEYKSFSFCPVASKTSKGKHCRLQFTVNYLLEDGNQKTQVLQSEKFRIVSRITEKHRYELEPWNGVKKFGFVDVWQ